MVNNTMWLPPNAANVLIMGHDGGFDAPVNYTAHADSGKHVLFIGGSQVDAYIAAWSNYFAIGGGNAWHQFQ